ncbi:TIGR02647 family protein [Crenothrix sp.]|uniref:TIGR02647 family protein n=1 Tax=Crenothrix sp. TaxID=3100433 RepID=UPI00374CC256
MPYTQDILEELDLLSRYNLSTTLEGIKVHQHTASEATIAATQRLHKKGLVSQEDGGYLTSLGREAAEHAQAFLRILKPD